MVKRSWDPPRTKASRKSVPRSTAPLPTSVASLSGVTDDDEFVREEKPSTLHSESTPASTVCSTPPTTSSPLRQDSPPTTGTVLPRITEVLFGMHQNYHGDHSPSMTSSHDADASSPMSVEQTVKLESHDDALFQQDIPQITLDLSLPHSSHTAQART